MICDRRRVLNWVYWIFSWVGTRARANYWIGPRKKGENQLINLEFGLALKTKLENLKEKGAMVYVLVVAA